MVWVLLARAVMFRVSNVPLPALKSLTWLLLPAFIIKSELRPAKEMSRRFVAGPPIFPAEAVNVTPALLLVTRMLAVEDVKSALEESVMEPTVAVTFTAVTAVGLAVVMAVDPRFTLPREDTNVT